MSKPYISRLVVKANKPNGGPGYEIEFTFPQASSKEEFEAARQRGIEAIRQWLKEKEPLSLSEVEALPWKSYQTKEAVGPGHTGWIMWEKDNGGFLARAVEEQQEKRLKLGPYDFTFSGDKKQFISRKVIEPTPEQEPPKQ